MKSPPPIADAPVAVSKVSRGEGSVATPSGIARYALAVKIISALVIIASFVAIARALPVDRGVEALSSWVERLGPLGPVVFGIVYALAALLFVPGSALTLAGGSVFGIVKGVIMISIASTTAAAIAFLIARYFARSRVETKIRSMPRFAVIDRAIGAGGTKIVALLRLSPAVPFSLSNYMFGLTAIRFWPYVLASWIFMLPGTVMYVYLGHVARETIATAAGSDDGKTPGEWALLIVGMIATIAVTLYVTRIARNALQLQITNSKEERSMNNTESKHGAPKQHGWPSSATVLACVALVIATGAVWTNASATSLADWFGPPSVTMKEAYKSKPDGPNFDHSAFDALLRKHVDESGFVGYAGLRQDAEKLDAYIQSLASAPFDALGRDQKLALLINAYNAFTLRLILDYAPIDSIKDISSRKRWDASRWSIASQTWSLSSMEHKWIRSNFKEPRIHFALVCAAVGCPKLRNEAYVAERIEEQLADQARYVHTHDRWFRFDAAANRVYLTKLYDWFDGDFEQTAGSVLKFAAKYSSELKRALATGKKPRITWLPYDWSLNDKRNSGK